MAGEAKRPGPGCFGWVAIILLLLVVLWRCSIPSEDEARKDRADRLRSQAREVVTAAEFQQAWADNAVQAAARFKGKTLVISGKMTAARPSNGSALVVTLESPMSPPVELSVDGDNQSKVEALNPGDEVTAECARVLDVIGVRVPTQCQLR